MSNFKCFLCFFQVSSFFNYVVSFLVVCMERLFLKEKPIFLRWEESPSSVKHSDSFSFSFLRVMLGVFVIVSFICWFCLFFLSV